MSSHEATGLVVCFHNTHAPSAEADVARATRQQSVATTMHDRRVIMGFVLPVTRTSSPRSTHLFINPLLCPLKSGVLSLHRRCSAFQEPHRDNRYGYEGRVPASRPRSLLKT